MSTKPATIGRLRFYQMKGTRFVGFDSITSIDSFKSQNCDEWIDWSPSSFGGGRLVEMGEFYVILTPNLTNINPLRNLVKVKDFSLWTVSNYSLSSIPCGTERPFSIVTQVCFTRCYTQCSVSSFDLAGKKIHAH
jgi:hypothetical protein